MVGKTEISMTMSIVRNILQKQDSSHAAVTTSGSIGTLQQCYGRTINRSDFIHYNAAQDQKIIKFSKSVGSSPSTIELETITYTRTSGCCRASKSWVFPPKAPSPNIYNCVTHDAMSDGERICFKSFKKQFSGRFKRLVSHKKDSTAPIPPELKPQLKTIYVY